MDRYLPRPVEILFLAVLVVGAVAILLRDPTHFWQNAWLPALAIATTAFRRWWARLAAAWTSKRIGLLLGIGNSALTRRARSRIWQRGSVEANH